MKYLGFIFIAFGLALLLFVIFSLLNEGNRTLTPIPENKGVRVIFISPTK